MSYRLIRSPWLLVPLAVLLLDGFGAAAATGDAQATGNRFLKDYREAFESSNPFILDKYDPKGLVFHELATSEWFDNIKQTRLEIRDPVFTSVDEDWGQFTIKFVKVQEDLLLSGLFTRGIVRVEIDMVWTPDGYVAKAHRAIKPDGAEDNYRSQDPRTWGPEHHETERALYLGLELLREGDVAGAERYVMQASQLLGEGKIPGFVSGDSFFVATCYYARALLSAKQGNYAMSDAALGEALRVHPDFPMALNLMGIVRYENGEYERALSFWRQSLSVYSAQSAVAVAVDWLDAVVATKDDEQRNQLLSMADMPPSQLVGVLNPLLKSKPRVAFATRMLARAYWEGGDLEKGIEVVRNSGRTGKDPEVTWLAARLNLKAGHIEEARSLLESLEKSDPGYRDTPLVLAAIHAASGRFSEALARLATLQASPDFPGAHHALLAKYSLLSGRLLDAYDHLGAATRSRMPTVAREEAALMRRQISGQGR